MNYNDLESTINYIKELLTYKIDGLAERIIYTHSSNLKKITKANGSIVIIKSDFFEPENYGSEMSVPKSPFDFMDTKVIFGENKEIRDGNNHILYADLISSSYFLLTRYEEMVFNKERDEYGNYPCRSSFLYCNRLLLRPLIDEYSQLILKLFSEMDGIDYNIDNKFSSLAFTHDIDRPFCNYRIGGVVADIWSGIVEDNKIDFAPLLNWLGIYRVNRQDTWTYMLTREKELKESSSFHVDSICFIIASKRDDSVTTSYIFDKKTKTIISDMIKNGAIIGQHTGFDDSKSEERIKEEKTILEDIIGKPVFCQRNHYLRQERPEDQLRYYDTGFTDDYTTGYNESPGFRLGTTRIVKFIDPNTGKLYDLNIHGLHIMDGSLDGLKPYQLELKYEDALDICRNVIDIVKKYNGDLCILYHNGMFKKNNYHKKLYDWIIEYCGIQI